MPSNLLRAACLAVLAAAATVVPGRAAGEKPPAVDTQGIVVDGLAAAQLGKALFWDVTVGSDGVACASCHFHAGADVRVMNQFHPGPNGRFGLFPDGGPMGPNGEPEAGDLPLRKLKDPGDRESGASYDVDDVMGSAGVFTGRFRSVKGGTVDAAGSERCARGLEADNPYHRLGIMYRQSTGRNAQSVVNAAFFHRQFWDGRANAVFNGVDPFGRRSHGDPAVGVLVASTSAKPTLTRIAIGNSSLASQAVGPALNDVEMSCAGRQFRHIGRKLLGTRALSTQVVSPTDSLFAASKGLVATGGKRGLTQTYGALVRRAFASKYWSQTGRFRIASDGTVVADAGGYTQAELNFSLFFGLAVQAYERRLVSLDSAFDRGELSAAARRGRTLFEGKAACQNCHDGPLFTTAAVIAGQTVAPLERVNHDGGGAALVDRGFFNIGVRPTKADLGLGGVDPEGNGLSFARQFVRMLRGLPVPDRFKVDPCSFTVNFTVDLLPGKPCSALPSATAAASLRTAVDGAFKVPSLRNVALTPPYMHTGGFGTLSDVVRFYDRGGDSRRTSACNGKGDTTGFGAACSNRNALVKPLGLTAGERADLVAFLKGLTDRRVACHAGPFDHPELPILSGHLTTTRADGRAGDRIFRLPATGRDGLEAIGKPCFPNSGAILGSLQSVLANDILE